MGIGHASLNRWHWTGLWGMNRSFRWGRGERTFQAEPITRTEARVLWRQMEPAGNDEVQMWGLWGVLVDREREWSGNLGMTSYWCEANMPEKRTVVESPNWGQATWIQSLLYHLQLCASVCCKGDNGNIHCRAEPRIKWVKYLAYLSTEHNKWHEH